MPVLSLLIGIIQIKNKTMRTIRTKVYFFNELSEEAKQTAINKQRPNVDTDYIYDEAHETVKAFNELFNLSEHPNNWLNANAGNIENDVLKLRGVRLQKYLWNNFKNGLFKGKYYSLWSKKDVSYKHYKDGYPVLKSRYSKVIKENCCVLTGMCYDNDMLEPIYSFLLKRDFSNCTTNFCKLLNDCFNSLKNTIENEIEYKESDAGVTEEIMSNEYEFTKNGNRFTN
jgi:hypothetical protein